MNFNEYLLAIELAKSSLQVREMLQELGRSMSPIGPVIPQESILAGIDYVSLAIMHESQLDYGAEIPVESYPDGNCLFNSVSILISGNQSMASELKVNFFF